MKTRKSQGADKNLVDLRSVTDNQVVNTVEFDNKINQALLEKIEGVISVKEIGGGKYQVISGAVDVRPSIFKMATEQNWTLLGMQQEEHSLESVFQTLTGRKDA